MPLNFPTNPTLNQTYTYGGNTYTFNGNLWTKSGAGAGGASITVSEEGNVIATSVTNINFIGASITASGSGSNVTITASGSGGSGATVTVSNTAPTSPTTGALWVDSDFGDLNVYFSNAWVIVGGGGSSDSENLTGNVKTGGTITATKPFFLGGTTISENTTIPANFNAMTPGPVTVSNNITITVPDGSTWTVV